MLAGLLLGLILGVMLGVRAALERNRLAALSAAMVLVVAAAGGVITVSRRQPSEMLVLIELALTLSAGPIALLLWSGLLRRAIPVRLVVVLPAAAFALLAGLSALYGGDPVIAAVPIHAAFTLWGWLLFARGGEPTPRGRKRRSLVLVLLTAATVANAASLARLFLSDVRALEPIVPATLSLLLLALVAAMLWGFLGRSAPLLTPPPDPGGEAGLLARRAAEAIESGRLFGDPALRIESVAERLGIDAGALGRAIAASDWGSFAAMLRALRLAQASAMLADPAECATSIDAIGLICGFRSRSAFYEAFRRQHGESPGAWRERALSLSGK